MLSLQDFKLKLKAFADDTNIVSPTLEFFWCFELKASRAAVWSYLSDTSRFNRELGLAPRQQIEKDGKIFVETVTLGFKQAWVEEPWTWIAGETIASRRQYSKGLAKRVHAVFYIEDDQARDRRLVYIYFGWTPRNVFWNVVLKASRSHLQNQFKTAFTKIDAHLAQSQNTDSNALAVTAPALSETASRKIQLIRTQLLEKKLNPSTVDHLCQYVSVGDNMDLEAIKVVPLARKWKLGFRELLVTCLHATRLGLLNLSWKVICPHCRSSRFSAATLGDIPENAQCTVCEIDFASSGPDAVEVVFEVHPSIRKVETQLYCAAEPAKKPHIKMQQRVAPKTTLDVPLNIADGTYRGRWLGSGIVQTFQVDHLSENHTLTLSCGIDGESGVEPIASGEPLQLQVANPGDEQDTFILEELWWTDLALKPSHVFSVQEFKDLFSEEHLSSNVKLSLGEQTILFTDIVGSTEFYENVGDAKAFFHVRNHFQEVFKEVANHQGVVVKTIGDAVMASYLSIYDAMESAIAIQKRFHRDRMDTPIRLRISIHMGPVIAVHLNSGVDYFGNAVNFGAKIQACAGASEIAMSKEVYLKLTENETHDLGFPYAVRKNKRDGARSAEVIVFDISGRAALKLVG